MSDQLLLTIPKAADRLGFAINTVRKMIENGDLRVIRLGSRVGVPTQELERWVNEQLEAHDKMQ